MSLPGADHAVGARPALLALLAVFVVAASTDCRGRRDERRGAPPARRATSDAAPLTDAVEDAAGSATAAPAPDAPTLVVQGTAVPPRVGTLDTCAGACRLARRRTAPTAPEGAPGPGTALYAGDLLETPPDSPAELTLAGGTRLRLWPGSKLLLGLPHPNDLGLPAGGLAATGPPSGEAMRLFTPLGTVEPLRGRFVARIAAGGRALLFGAADTDDGAPPPVLSDGLGGATPLGGGALHVLGPAAVPAGSAPWSWKAGEPVPEEALERARLDLEARAASVEDDRPATALALARGLDADLETLEATRAENRRLLAELERSDLPAAERGAVRDALRESARRSVEAERALANRWYRLELMVAGTGVTAGAPWTLHVASGLERRRESVEAALRGGAALGGP